MHELSDDAGACRDAHLDHDLPEEALDRIRADVHSLSDLFARKAFGEMPHGFDFAIGQSKPRQYVRDDTVALNGDCHGGIGTTM